MAIFKREKSEHQKRIEEFDFLFSKMIKSDEYISHKQLESLIKSFEDIFNDLNTMSKNHVLNHYCRKNKIQLSFALKQLEKFNKSQLLVEQKNIKFISCKLISEKTYLDNILKESDPNISLDEEQRRVVLTDDDRTLVVAGAGSGKTTTIVAKVKYLVDKKGIDPEDILIVSFTREATNELKIRIQKKLKINAKISTFHSIGNDLISDKNTKRHNISGFGFLVETLKEHFIEKANDDAFIQKTLLFFSSYLEAPFDDSNKEILFKKLQDDDYTTLKQDLKDKLSLHITERMRAKRTIQDERVSSYQEVQIANFLFINGIDYTYQPLYQYTISGTTKPYLPDFEIKQGSKHFFLEHFALSESGINNRFSLEEQEIYKKHINDKIILHKKHGTKLIYTFSNYNDGRDLIIHLKELLVKNGFKLNRINDKEIYKKIIETTEDKYFIKFINLIGNFINKIKVNNWNQTKIQEFKILAKDERTKLFLDIAFECYLIYEQKLKTTKTIDFEDMINKANNILDSYIKENKKLRFKYIFIDEYQDISLQRFNLAQKLSKASDAKIIAVGDDWQSIFRFAGGNINLFTDFEKHLGYSKLLKITNTYRNSQELIDIAGNFVQKNKQQIRKELKSSKNTKDPVIIMSYDDSYKKDDDKTPFIRMCEAIEEAIGLIVQRDGEGKEILLIGRFNFDGHNLSRSDLFIYKKEKRQVISKKYPKTPIYFFTAHSSKGLGYDNVIIINGKDAFLGFPSKIDDDPVMKLVIKNDDEFEYAEERRLFYVALTRTKNRVFIIVPQFSPSKFVLEIQGKFTNIVLKGGELNPREEIERRKCPYCGYPLQLRRNTVLGNAIWLCSNEPEQCGFITNNIKGGRLGISKCPECHDGYLVVKDVKDREDFYMLGCNNYRPDNTGCRYVIFSEDFTYDLERLKFNKETFKDHHLYKDLDVYRVLTTIYNGVDRVVKEYPNNSFDTRVNALIFKGKENKIVKDFQLNQMAHYGVLKTIALPKILKTIDYLIYEELLKITEENGFQKLSLGSKNINDLNYYSIKRYISRMI